MVFRLMGGKGYKVRFSHTTIEFSVQCHVELRMQERCIAICAVKVSLTGAVTVFLPDRVGRIRTGDLEWTP